MRRQFEIKTAGILLGLLLIGGIGLALIHNFQVVRHADSLLRRADRAVASNHPEEALQCFDRYLSIRPDDTDALARKGLTLEKCGSHSAALPVLYEVLRREPGRTEVRFRLIQCLHDLKRFPEMMTQAELLRPDWPQKGEIEHILGWGCEAQRDYVKAAEWFVRAIALDPNRIPSYVILANIYQDRLDRPSEARTIIYRLVQLLQSRRRFVEAGDVLATYEVRSGLSPDLARMGADIALAVNNIDRALALSRLAVPGDSRDYRDFLWLAHVYRQAESNAREPEPKHFYLGEADKYLRQATALAPYAPDTWIALVEHLVRTGRAAETAEVLQQVKKAVPAGQLPIALARCYEVLGLNDQAESCFREALSQSPNDFILLSAAADFFRHCDQPEKAEPLLRQLLDPNLAAPLSIQAQARRDLALIFERLQKLEPDSARTRELREKLGKSR